MGTKLLSSSLKPGLMDLVFLLGYFSLAVVQLSGFFDDPGTGWHLKTGEYIYDQKVIPNTDPFLHSPALRIWVADQWFSDLLLETIRRVSGFEGIAIIYIAIFLYTFFVFLPGKLSRYNSSPIAILLAALMVFKISQIHFLLRPVMLSFPLFAVVYFSLLRSSKEPCRGVEWKRLSLLFIFWANIHPSFVLGLFLMLLFCIEKFILALFTGEPWKAFQRSIFFFFLFGVMTLCNPYGIELHTSIVALGNSEFFMSLHNEWKSPDFHQAVAGYWEFMVFTIVIGLLVYRNKKLCENWFEGLVALSFCSLSLEAIRYFPYCAIVLALPFTQVVLWFFEDLQERGWRPLKRAFQMLQGYERKSSGGTVGLFVCVLLLAVGFFQGQVIFAKDKKLNFSKERYPVGVVEEFQKLNLRAVILAESNYGGFLTAHLYPESQALLDDRNTLLGEEEYKLYQDALKSPDRFMRQVKNRQASHILARKGSRLALLSEFLEFPVLVKDERFFIYKVEFHTNTSE